MDFYKSKGKRVAESRMVCLCCAAEPLSAAIIRPAVSSRRCIRQWRPELFHSRLAVDAAEEAPDSGAKTGSPKAAEPL